MKTGLLLINLGTPDAPTPGAVGRYLREFLGDERVIDIPWLARKFLVNVVIAPTRSFRSAREYKKVWTTEGSPLLTHGQNVRDALQTRLDRPEMKVAFEGEVKVELAMRYQSPSMDGVLKRMQKEHYDRIIILPLYAQYASAVGTTISAPNLAGLNTFNYLLIHTDLVSRGLLIGNTYHQVIGKLTFNVGSGSQQNYEPFNVPSVSEQIAGNRIKSLRFWVTNELNETVFINDTWAASYRITWE